MLKIRSIATLTLSSLALSIAQADPSPTPSSMPSATPSPAPSMIPSPIPTYHPFVDRQYRFSDPVEHTSVKDQGHVGFCWSYTAMGHIEGEYKKNTQKVLDLSEEWIGFFYLFDQVMAQAPEYFKAEYRVPELEGKNGWQRFWSKFAAKKKNTLNSIGIKLFYGVSEGAPDMTAAMKVMKKYGVVPESVFQYKIIGSEGEQAVTDRIMAFVKEELRDPVKNKKYRIQNSDGTYSLQPVGSVMMEGLAKFFALEDTGLGPNGKCDSCALLDAYKTGFNLAGRQTTPLELLQDTGFNPDAYTHIDIKAENHTPTVERMRSALDAGHSLPIGVVLFKGYSEAIKGSGFLTPESCGISTACTPVGGHAVLVVAYTTQANTGAVNGFLFKNSWGPIGLSSQGTKYGDLGFQVMTTDYLKESFGLHAGEKAYNWEVLLPAGF